MTTRMMTASWSLSLDDLNPRKPAPKERTMNREGFWKNSDHPLLPMPRISEKPWKGQEEFLAKLRQVEAALTPGLYRGVSTCRVCGCVNGNGEYTYQGWVWPSGYGHYIEAHNLRPSLAFQELILGVEL